MTGTINAFYGAEVKRDDGQPAGKLPNNTVVRIVEPNGKPAWHVGEWTKIEHDGVAGWVAANQLVVDYV